MCEVCGKQFVGDKIRSHARTHNEQAYTYQCTDCDKKFRSNLQLVQHQHVHTGVKSFQCDHCERQFAKRSSLIAHERQCHTLETPYECAHCGVRFHTREKLNAHVKKTHPIKQEIKTEVVKEEPQLLVYENQLPPPPPTLVVEATAPLPTVVQSPRTVTLSFHNF